MAKDIMMSMVLSKIGNIENNPLKLIYVGKPDIASSQVLVKISACGVCRSNLHLIEGDWQKYGLPSKLPIIPGHELVGKVEKVGDTVTKIKVGDRVGICPLYSSCQECKNCIYNHENLCDYAEFTGETVHGGYAEYLSAPEDFVNIVPDSINDEHAAPLFCAGVTAYKAVKASETTLAKSIGVFGVGGVGHLAIQIAKLYGARVIGISRNKNHLDLARTVGADYALAYNNNSHERSTESFIHSLKREEGALLDSAIVFAPSEEVIGTAIKAVRKGGIIVIGVFGDIPNFLFHEEKIIKGTVIGSRRDVTELIELTNNYNLKPIINSFKLQDANFALAKLKLSAINGRAVLMPK